MDERKQELLRGLPKIDEMLSMIEREQRCMDVMRDIVKDACRVVVDEIRGDILAEDGVSHLPTLEQAVERAVGIVENYRVYRLRRVINATGVILHTNLGRAPLCKEAIERVTAVAGCYSNLEYDLDKGRRGLRYDSVKKLLCAISGAEEAVVVNNNAAAVMLVLNTLAQRKEVIVSRGELIEIGGEFRIPEVMEKSGAVLKEVGTTNRTRLADYEKAIGPETGLILKVHTSNFRIVGFTESSDRGTLVELGKRHHLPVVEDLGSGCFIELDRYNLEREPTVRDSLQAGVDVVTFSGDKLLGGPQAGIILGKRELLEKIAKNPLNRALRIDKMTLAALEGTLVNYLHPEKAVEGIPVLRALTEPVALVRKRAVRLANMLKRDFGRKADIFLVDGFSMAGGGSLPDRGIQTVLVGITSASVSAAELERRLRRREPAVIVRVAEERILMDLRTLRDDDLPELKRAIGEVLD